MSLSGLRVAVAGGGVAGPVAALLLAGAGADVVLLERVAQFGTAGGGYVLAPNGLSVLYGLGFEDALRPRGRVVRETTTLLADGTPLARNRIRDFGHGLDHGGSAGGRTYLSLAAGARPLRTALKRKDLVAVSRLWEQALPPVGPVLAQLGSFDELLVNEIDVVTCRHWVDGRLVLIGDAAHAMPPHLGQGANTALLDAAVLVMELADASRRGAGVEAGLAGYPGTAHVIGHRIRQRPYGRARRQAGA